MSDKKLCLKDYLTCKDDEMLSKTRKKMNKKSHKGRHYGLDHGYLPGGSDGADGGGIGESEEVTEMHDGVVPGAFSANVISRLPDGTQRGKEDTRKQNRRNAPRKRSFAQFLQFRNRAEEEEWVDDEDDEPMNDFDRFDRNKEIGADVDEFMDAKMRADMGLPMDDDPELEPDMDDDMDFLRRLTTTGSNDYGIEGNNAAQNDFDDLFGDEEEEIYPDEEDEVPYDDPEEYDDIDPEEELDFEQDDDEGIDDEDIEDIQRSTGTFADFFRMSDDEFESDDVPPVDDMDDDYEEEAEEIGPGGFQPGSAIDPGSKSTVAPGGKSGGQGTKLHDARIMFKQLIQNPDLERRDIIDEFIARLGVTESTAVSYYEKLAKEAGLTGDNNQQDPSGMGGMGEEDPYGEMGADEEMVEPAMSQEEIDQQPADKQGIIRQVDGAHLVYKKQMEDGGFEELWVYNIGDKLEDALSVRRAILAGTDIPRGHTRSEDGKQTYTLSTMGNAQMLHVTGLAN